MESILNHPWKDFGKHWVQQHGLPALKVEPCQAEEPDLQGPMATASPQPPAPEPPDHASGDALPIDRWIKTDCGRSRYRELAARPGALARLRLAWFVVIAALRDWPLANPDQDS